MKIQTANASVPGNIRRIIDARGLKQYAVAERAGINNQAFSNMMTGHRLIKASDIANIADALGVTPNDLFRQV
mgnify:CR=1 FL=1